MIFFPNDSIGSNNNIHQNLTNPPILAKELTTIQKLQAAWNKFTGSVKSFFNTIQTKINNTVTFIKKTLKSIKDAIVNLVKKIFKFFKNSGRFFIKTSADIIFASFPKKLETFLNPKRIFSPKKDSSLESIYDVKLKAIENIKAENIEDYVNGVLNILGITCNFYRLFR